MMQTGPEKVTMVPLADIEVMNPRDRNQRIYREIVDNIRRVGLKKPITVTPRKDPSGRIRYRLVCGEGRLNAYRIAGQTHIPALVIEVDDADAYVMSLVENIARRHAQPLEILARINALLQKGYSTSQIVQKTGLSIQYVDGTAFLLKHGEERLLVAVQRGTIPFNVAIDLVKASQTDEELGRVLQEAYERKDLRGRQLLLAKRLAERRKHFGKDLGGGALRRKAYSASSLVKTYNKEVERQRQMVRKSELSQNMLVLIVEALRQLFQDEDFYNVLRAEVLDTLPRFLEQRIRGTT